MKVCAIIVTYDNRFSLVKQVIDACIREGVNKIIVVDNDSATESKKKLRLYEEKHKDKVEVLYLTKNYGSAGGYKRGLEYAYNYLDCKLIWLLDDDNSPEEGALKKLIEYWNSLKEENKEERIALLACRTNKKIYLKAIEKGQPYLVLGRQNSFLGFHILNVFQYIYIYILEPLFSQSQSRVERGIPTFGIIATAPYGGLFFNKRLIDNIGYPNEYFHLYWDDTEWTYRITKSGGKIILISESKISDIDSSDSRDCFNPFKVLAFWDPLKLYYFIRNEAFFWKKETRNKIIYVINKYLYLPILLLIIFLLARNPKRVRLILKAIKDGEAGNLCKAFYNGSKKDE